MSILGHKSLYTPPPWVWHWPQSVPEIDAKSGKFSGVKDGQT